MTAHPFVILPSVDSTNNHAMREIRSGQAQNGVVYFALEQTQGKGQREKKWISDHGQNITMSMVWQPLGLKPADQYLVSCATALACHDLFNKYTAMGTSIKWPNDLYWNDRKAGGILIENIIKGKNWDYSIIGMGININQVSFTEMAAKPVSLKQITGKEWDVLELATLLCDLLKNRLDCVLAGEKKVLLESYNELLYGKGKQLQFKDADRIFAGVVEGVNETGELLIREKEQRSYSFGTIEWLL